MNARVNGLERSAMRSRFTGALLGGALLACGGTGPSAAPSEKQLKLVVPPQVSIEAPTTSLVQLIVVNPPDAGAVEISSPNLPTFATLSGVVLTLTPTFKDAGDYSIHLDVASNGSVDEETLSLHVSRSNTPPMWLPVPQLTGTTTADAAFEAIVCDAEGDDITLQAEVVPSAEAFTNTANYEQTSSFATVPPLSNEPQPCASFSIPLTGLDAGTYLVQARTHDSLGAYDPYGWVSFGGITIYAPATDGGANCPYGGTNSNPCAP